MGKIIDLTNKRFGRLTVIRYGFRDKHKHHNWVCKCDCSPLIERCIDRSSLKSGGTKFCGCLHRETASKMVIERNFKHGLSHHPMYQCWRNMMARCYNKNYNGYKYYGGRENPITVCKYWHNLKNFIEDLKDIYRPGLEIDRIDPEKGYYKENVRFVTDPEQSDNKRHTIIINFNGKTQTLKKWSDELKISHSALYCRIYSRNWTVEKAFLTPLIDKHEQYKRNSPKIGL